MLFTADITVETTNTEASKKEQVIKVAHGIITWVSILMPPGCHGLVNCTLFHHEHQIAPSTENMAMIGDGMPIEWNEYYECYQPPYELKAKLWGVGCSYDHTITVRIAVLPRKAVAPTSVADAVKALFSTVAPKRIFTAD